MKIKDKILDGLSLFSSVFMIIILVVVLINSLQFYSQIYIGLGTFQQRMFFTSIVVAVVTIFGQWISGRYNSIRKIIDSYKEVNNGRRKKERSSV